VRAAIGRHATLITGVIERMTINLWRDVLCLGMIVFCDAGTCRRDVRACLRRASRWNFGILRRASHEADPFPAYGEKLTG
jgi:hypothetical protein